LVIVTSGLLVATAGPTRVQDHAAAIAITTEIRTVRPASVRIFTFFHPVSTRSAEVS
jgi:hypothetical protein